jgi:subfamily B ATP-binding cassette protein HlyB/CyaB
MSKRFMVQDLLHNREYKGMQQQVHAEEELRRQGSLLRCLLVAAMAMGKEGVESKLAKWYPPGYALNEAEFIKTAAKLHIKALKQAVEPDKLPELKIPAIARLQDGRYVILGRSTQTHILVFFPEAEKPVLLALAELENMWDGSAFILEKTFSFEDLAREFNFAWFMPVILRYKNLFGEVVAASFFLQFFGLVMPLFTQVVVDKVIGNRGLATLDVLAAALVMGAGFQAGMSILRTYVLTHTTNRIDVILGARLFRHILALPVQYFEQRRVGDTLMRVGAMNTIRDFLTGSALTAMLDAVFVFVFLAVMFSYSASLTLIALAALPVYLVQNILVTPLYQQRLQEVWAAGTENNAFLVEAVTGIQTVKAMALEPQFRHKWEQLIARYVQKTFNNGILNMLLGNSGTIIDRLAGLAVLWYGGYLVMLGKLTLGQLIAFQMLSAQTSAPVLRLVNMWQTVQQAILSMERLGDILHTRPENLRAATQAGQNPPIQGNIMLDQVTFRYLPYQEPVLNGISLQIKAGSRVGIVGRSGSGKSTLAKLLQRMYIPEQGSITMDGVNITEIDPVWLRRQTGVVMQENYLFNGSVRDNIAAAAPSAPMEAIIRVAQMAGAHEFILELPEGYDTKVGERGTALSGGQRQRIAIARALLTDPRILIFDEATSALDYESEHIIMNNMEQIVAGRTFFIIAHRLSTVRQCDLILVIDKGRLVEQGTHAELVAGQGLYYQLSLQQEG